MTPSGTRSVASTLAEFSWTELPWHPVLIALAAAISFWTDAAVSPFAAARSVAAAMLIAALLVLLFSAILRSGHLGGIVASAVLAVVWSKHLVELVTGLTTRMGPALAVVWAAAIVLAAVLAWRIGRDAISGTTRQRATLALNQAALLLLSATLLMAVVTGRVESALPDLAQGAPLSSLQESEPGADLPALPDIYAVLLDGYPRADVLEYAFDLNNQPFLDALAERGFTISALAHSPYLWTHVTVPAVVNMEYVENIPDMAAAMEGRAPRQPTLRRAVADGVAFDVAREHGYETVAVGGGFEEVAARQADVWIDGAQLSEFELNFLRSTYLGDLAAWVAPDFASAQHRERVKFNLDVLAEVAAADSLQQRLVFAHIPSPHAPIVFGAGGVPVTAPMDGAFYADSPVEGGRDTKEFRRQYSAQLPYLNRLVLDSIDRILANSDRPPVIVIFADHGSASAVDWTETLPADSDPARLLERTGVLFAALTPGHPSPYAEDASPVDLFRVLFDAYLGTDYGIAEPPSGGGQIEPVDAGVLRP